MNQKVLIKELIFQIIDFAKLKCQSLMYQRFLLWVPKINELYNQSQVFSSLKINRYDSKSRRMVRNRREEERTVYMYMYMM